METKQHTESQEQDQFQSTPLNSNDLTLVPYVLHEGQWTLPDHFLRGLLDQLKLENTFETVFYEGTITTGDEFVQLMQNPANIPVFVFQDKEWVGFAWLNGAAGDMAYGHFCFRRAYWDIHTLPAGKKIVEYWFSFPGSDGPLFEFILGLVPNFNESANRYVKRLGFSHVGSIPGLLQCEYRADRASAEIYYISRFDYVEEKPETCPDSSG